MIKVSREKLILEFDFDKAISESDIQYLPIDEVHSYQLRDFPWIHHEPFDRIQIARSIVENILLITRDANILSCDFSVLEA